MEQDLTNPELAILGLVAEMPKYGYQIEQDIEQRGMREWTEIGFSSIYYVLNKLEAAGLLAGEKHEQGDRPARKIYHLAEPGWAGYRHAVQRRLEAPRPNSSDFELALANLYALKPEDCFLSLDRHRQALESKLEQVRARQEQAGGIQLPLPAQAVFEHGRAMMTAELEWLTGLLERLAISSSQKSW